MLDLYKTANITVDGADGLSALSWEWAAGKAIEGAGSALTNYALNKILGPNPWETSVTQQLSEISLKLDQVLNEIKALRPYIRDEIRQQWRDKLRAGVYANIIGVGTSIAAAREQGNLSGNDVEQLNIYVNNLGTSIREICSYSDNQGNPLGMPLYSSVCSGIIMFNIGQRVLQISKTTINADMEYFKTRFKDWSSILEQQAKTMIDNIQASERELTDFPREGFVSWTGYHGQAYLDAGPTGEGQSDFVCYFKGRIDGGLTNDFRKSGELEIVPVGRFIDLAYDHAYPLDRLPDSAFPLIPQYLTQFRPPQDGHFGIEQPGTNINQRFVAERNFSDLVIIKLNAKRNSVISTWDDIRKLQSVAGAIADWAVKFEELKIGVAK
jgi:hypothetical protein